MQRIDTIPANYKRIQVVPDLATLFNAQFQTPVHCYLLPRSLTGDFNGLAQCMNEHIGIKGVKHLHDVQFESICEKLPLTPEQQEAATVIMSDFSTFHEKLSQYATPFNLDYKASVRLIGPEGYTGYDERDVELYHEDRTLGPLGRFACSYNEPVTEILRNEDAVFKGGMIYEPKSKESVPVSCSPGDITRHQGLDTRDNTDAPFIHRALKGPPRLMLVAGVRPY